jgi:hypothetical protein
MWSMRHSGAWSASASLPSDTAYGSRRYQTTTAGSSSAIPTARHRADPPPLPSDLIGFSESLIAGRPARLIGRARSLDVPRASINALFNISTKMPGAQNGAKPAIAIQADRSGSRSAYGIMRPSRRRVASIFAACGRIRQPGSGNIFPRYRCGDPFTPPAPCTAPAAARATPLRRGRGCARAGR